MEKVDWLEALVYFVCFMVNLLFIKLLQENNMSVKRIGHQGFTLIELMVVLVILGVLASLIVPRIMGRPEEARRIKARVDIQSLETALKLYNLDNGVYPSTEQGLQALVELPSAGVLPKNWRDGGYLEKGKVPEDPWGNEYIYLSPGSHGDFDLISYGADGESGGEGKDEDVVNWELE
jgi:general secretion pathway protein G